MIAHVTGRGQRLVYFLANGTVAWTFDIPVAEDSGYVIPDSALLMTNGVLVYGADAPAGFDYKIFAIATGLRPGPGAYGYSGGGPHRNNS